MIIFPGFGVLYYNVSFQFDLLFFLGMSYLFIYFEKKRSSAFSKLTHSTVQFKHNSIQCRDFYASTYGVICHRLLIFLWFLFIFVICLD